MSNKVDTKKEKSNGDTPSDMITVKDKTVEKKKPEVPVRRESSSIFHQFERFMSDLRHDFFENWLDMQPRSLFPRNLDDHFRTPLTNIEETKKDYVIKAELPGMLKDQISVYLDQDKLEIVAEAVNESTEEKEGNIIRREYHESNFYRSFVLPSNVDSANINVKFDNGILKIKLPKTDIKDKSKKKLEIK